MTDIQHCLRLNDLDEVGDGTHCLDFHMLGLFSFRQMTVRDGVVFWMNFLTHLGVGPDTVTIHPDCPSWTRLYDDFDVVVREDPECVWSDGDIHGYCTEFYRQGVEIGNIVNPLGDCLDCGFGGERVQHFLDINQGVVPMTPTRSGVLARTIEVLLDSGVRPGSSQQGYVLRKLIRVLLREGHGVPDHPLVHEECRRRDRILSRIPQLLRQHPNKRMSYFWDTHGVHPDDWENERPVV